MSHKVSPYTSVELHTSSVVIPFFIDSDEYFLFWEGSHQLIETADDGFIRYFHYYGFCLVEHRSLELLEKIHFELTEEKLIEHGLPPYVSIVLPSQCEYSYPSPADDRRQRRRYPGIFRSPAGRTEGVVFFVDDWDGYRAFIVKKIVE